MDIGRYVLQMIQLGLEEFVKKEINGHKIIKNCYEALIDYKIIVKDENSNQHQILNK